MSSESHKKDLNKKQSSLRLEAIGFGASTKKVIGASTTTAQSTPELLKYSSTNTYNEIPISSYDIKTSQKSVAPLASIQPATSTVEVFAKNGGKSEVDSKGKYEYRRVINSTFKKQIQDEDKKAFPPSSIVDKEKKNRSKTSFLTKQTTQNSKTTIDSTQRVSNKQKRKQNNSTIKNVGASFTRSTKSTKSKKINALHPNNKNQKKMTIKSRRKTLRFNTMSPTPSLQTKKERALRYANAAQQRKQMRSFKPLQNKDLVEKTAPLLKSILEPKIKISILEPKTKTVKKSDDIINLKAVHPVKSNYVNDSISPIYKNIKPNLDILRIQQEYEDKLELEECQLSPGGTYKAGPDWRIKQEGITNPPSGTSKAVRLRYRTVSARARSRRGSLKDEFLTLTNLGRGGSSVVFKVIHVPSLQVAAIKRIRVGSKQKCEVVRHELQALHANIVPLGTVVTQSPCPNIVTFHDAYTDIQEMSVGLVLQYMDAGSLQDCVNDFPTTRTLNGKIIPKRPEDWTEKSISIVLYGILKGIEYLHSQQKLHRDIKPSNVLLSSAGEVKVSDFGIARTISEISSGVNDSIYNHNTNNSIDTKESTNSDTLSTAKLNRPKQSILSLESNSLDSVNFHGQKTFTGTMLYMSPERLEGLHYSYASDIWSVGLIIMVMALGQLPFQGVDGFWGMKEALKTSNGIRKIADKMMQGKHSLSSDLCDFCKQCLQMDPNKRPSAKQLLQHKFLSSAAKATIGQRRRTVKKMIGSRIPSYEYRVRELEHIADVIAQEYNARLLRSRPSSAPILQTDDRKSNRIATLKSLRHIPKKFPIIKTSINNNNTDRTPSPPSRQKYTQKNEYNSYDAGVGESGLQRPAADAIARLAVQLGLPVETAQLVFIDAFSKNMKDSRKTKSYSTTIRAKKQSIQ